MKRICLLSITLSALSAAAPASDFTLVASHFGSGGTGVGTSYTVSSLATATATRAGATPGGQSFVFPGFFASPEWETMSEEPQLDIVRTLAGAYLIAAAPDVPGTRFQVAADLMSWRELRNGGDNPLLATPTKRAFFRRAPIESK